MRNGKYRRNSDAVYDDYNTIAVFVARCREFTYHYLPVC